MAATSLPRTDDADAPLSGVKTYNDGASGPHSQAMILEDETQAPINGGNPLPVTVSAGTVWKYDTAGAAENVIQLHGAAGRLRELRVLLAPTVSSVRWFMLFDSPIAPINGDAPLWRGLAPPAGEASESFPAGIFEYGDTLYIAVSSTHDTLTISGADAFYHARGEV